MYARFTTNSYHSMNDSSNMPSLAQSARKVVARNLVSPEARATILQGNPECVDIELLQIVAEMEAAALRSRGRVEGHDYDSKPAFSTMREGARLLKYNDYNESVTIRVDCARVPSFWLEVEVPVENLLQFVATSKANGY